jgi:hypothetical protein
MKNLYLKEYQEVVVEKNGVKHRADVKLPDGTVVEFQHSPISPIEAMERTNFYGKVMWVFDLTKKDKIDWTKKVGNYGNTFYTFKHKWCPETMKTIPTPYYIHDTDGDLFQVNKIYDNGRGWGVFVEALPTPLYYHAGNPHPYYTPEGNVRISNRFRTYLQSELDPIRDQFVFEVDRLQFVPEDEPDYIIGAVRKTFTLNVKRGVGFKTAPGAKVIRLPSPVWQKVRSAITKDISPITVGTTTEYGKIVTGVLAND